MNECQVFRDLVEKYLDGIISDEQLAELKTHAESCEACRAEFDRCVLLQDVVKRALSSRMAAEQAQASVLARLAEEPSQPLQPARTGAVRFVGKRMAVAASILLAVGLLLGFALGRMGSVEPAGAPLTAQVPIRVAQLEGTVLVRHQSSDMWQILQAGSNVYLGDTFHSTAKSACVLELQDHSTIELDQNSMLVLKLHNGETQFFLEHGKCTAALESPHPPFFISTPNGRLEAVGTEFTVTVK